MEFLHSLINNINQQMLVVALLLVSIGWFISQYAKNSIPRLIFIGIGTYIILTYPPLHFYTFIAIGFVLAHIFFLLRFLRVQYYIFKEASINSYYLMLTIYGKILSVFKWILSVFETIKILFQTKSFSRAKNSYEKDNEQEQYYYRDYGFKDSSSESKQKSEESSQEHSSKYEYKEPPKQEVPKDDILNPTGNKDFDRFFSKSKYDVIGVAPSMSYDEINKAYRALAKKFHPDLGTIKDESGLVMKRINLAFDCFKSHKKGNASHRCEFCRGGY